MQRSNSAINTDTLVIDNVEYNQNNIPGVLILLDFEKAFDSVEWNFIRKSLEFLGFGPSIQIL
jgi:hypothetical protein